MVSVCAIGNKSLQLVNPRVNAVNIIMINCTIGIKRELCSAKYKALWANSAPYELIKNTDTCTSFLRLLRPIQLLISILSVNPHRYVAVNFQLKTSLFLILIEYSLNKRQEWKEEKY